MPPPTDKYSAFQSTVVYRKFNTTRLVLQSLPLPTLSSWFGKASDRYPLDLVEGDLITGTVVQLGGTRTFVRSHGLGVFERAASLKIGRDPSCPEGVAADLDLHSEFL